MKKVLISVATLTSGGAERVASIWANQLSEKGYDVYVLVYGRCENEYPLNKEVKVVAVCPSYADVKNVKYLERFKRMRALVKQISPDVVISFLYRMQIWMMAATFGRKLKRVETIRINPWFLSDAIKNPVAKMLWKAVYLRANSVIFQTAEQGEYFGKSVRKKGVVIPNPISEKYKNSPKTEYSEHIEKFVAAGRITEQKNYPVMIEAFGKAKETHPNIKLSIYGAGDEDYVSKIQKQIDDSGLSESVRLMGRTSDMLSALRESDAFLMTSDFEGMPNSLLEAMLVGLPCISTDCRTGPKDIIDNSQNGFLVRTGDLDSIAEAICNLADMDKVGAIRIGSAARKKILEICSEERSLAQLIATIEK
ncbi:MAG: glycosyltransferase [Clostridia bacterium]|nr:glycosyltransferase [Clostridia bacterium]